MRNSTSGTDSPAYYKYREICEEAVKTTTFLILLDTFRNILVKFASINMNIKIISDEILALKNNCILLWGMHENN